jgi:hypothetical protein
MSLTMHVRILQPTKSAMQSGRGKSKMWVIQPVLPTARAPEALMGWIAAGDSASELNQRLQFSSREAAIEFAAKQGWDYSVIDPQQRQITPRNYLDNFRSSRPQD